MTDDAGYPDPVSLRRALALLPTGHFLMTAAFDGARAGVLLHSVQRCSEDPVLLAVASRKGHAIDPIIRDSRAFAVCLVSGDDRLLARKFPPAEAGPQPGEEEVDPFDAIPVRTLRTGAPIPERAIAAFDCEVVRHVDLEADHELFVGLVLAAEVLRTIG